MHVLIYSRKSDHFIFTLVKIKPIRYIKIEGNLILEAYDNGATNVANMT